MMRESVDLLLVEDNHDDAILIEEVFAEAGLMNVMLRVQDGEEALVYLRGEGPYKTARRPDLVLLDINLPKRDGFELLEAMRADPRLQALPVIILTSSDREEDIVHSYASGACSFLRKPITYSQFASTMQEFERYWTAVSRLPRQEH